MQENTKAAIFGGVISTLAVGVLQELVADGIRSGFRILLAGGWPPMSFVFNVIASLLIGVAVYLAIIHAPKLRRECATKGARPPVSNADIERDALHILQVSRELLSAMGSGHYGLPLSHTGVVRLTEACKLAQQHGDTDMALFFHVRDDRDSQVAAAKQLRLSARALLRRAGKDPEEFDPTA